MNTKKMEIACPITMGSVCTSDLGSCRIWLVMFPIAFNAMRKMIRRLNRTMMFLQIMIVEIIHADRTIRAMIQVASD